jgi:mono/diheme cytochrome c family protein
MRIKAKHVILGVLALLVVLVLGAITAIGWEVILGPDARPTTDRKFDATEARLARVQYLAEGPAHCFLCHTEHSFATPDYPTIPEKKGAGWAMPIPELNNISARNITSDKETGLGNWTDDEIARAIREGVSRDGSALFPVMPYLNYRELDDEDLASIVVYIRTLKPIRNAVAKRQLPFPLEYIVNTIPKPIETPQPSHPASTPVERGQYLAKIADCHGCHTPTDQQGQPLPGLDFGGGGMFKDPGQGGKEVFTMNITSDPSGIAHYNESLFMQTIRTGQIGGRFLNHIMPFESFRNMTDADLSDIFAYLKSLKPVQHRISNTDPPTTCPICNQTHGLGELNVKK